MDNLRQSGKIVVNCCPMCIGDEESVDHHLLNCNVAQLISKCILELYQAWNRQTGSDKEEMWRLSFLVVIWIIRKEGVLWGGLRIANP